MNGTTPISVEKAIGPLTAADHVVGRRIGQHEQQDQREAERPVHHTCARRTGRRGARHRRGIGWPAG